MKGKGLIAASCLVALIALAPGPAVSLPQVLRCSASGTALYFTGNFEEYAWDDIRATGRCLSDTAGAQGATLTGYGLWGPPVYLELTVTIKLTDETGGTHFYRQHWTGLRATCSVGRVFIQNRAGAPVGTGNVKQCGPPVPEFTRIRLAMTWNFVAL